jgi:hypothetical protein
MDSVFVVGKIFTGFYLPLWFHGKIDGFRLKFLLKPIQSNSWIIPPNMVRIGFDPFPYDQLENS